MKNTKLRKAAVIKTSALLAVGGAGNVAAPPQVKAGTQQQVSVTINNHIHLPSPQQQFSHIQDINRIYMGRPLSHQTILILMTYDPFLVGRHLCPFIIQRHIRTFQRNRWFCTRRHIPLHRHPQFRNDFRMAHFYQHRNLRHDFPPNHMNNRTVVNNRTTITNTNVINTRQYHQNQNVRVPRERTSAR